MKTRPLAVALLVTLAPAVVPFLCAPLALAQSATDDTTTKMARQRFQEGVAFFDKHQYDQARAAFLQAYALRKHPVVLLNLAQSCVKSGHALEASRYFQQFLHDYSSATSSQRADAEAGLAEARSKLGHVDVSSAPSGAEIFIDDDRAGVAPFDHPIDVEPGMHTVRAHAHSDESVQVVATAGSVVTARFTAPPPVVAPPVVPVPTPPPVAPAEPPPAEPAPAPPEEAAPPPAAPPEAPPSHGFFPSNMTPVILGGAVALAGFGTAIVFAVEKGTAQNSANTVASQIIAAGGVQGTCVTPTTHYANACSVLSSDNDKVNTDALIANIGLGVGLGATALTALYFAVGSRDSSPSTASARPVVTPMVGKGLGGVALSATF